MSGIWWPRQRVHCAGIRARAFTLIEVLVVVAIIALLVAILLPSLSRARSISQRAVCMSNLSQLGKAMTVYAMENNDYFPMPLREYEGDVVYDRGPIPFTERSEYGANGVDDMSALFPRYLKDLKAWECPSARNIVRDREDLKRTYTTYAEPRYGIAYEYFPFMYYTLRFMTTGKPEYHIDSSKPVSFIRFSRLKRASGVVVTNDNDNTKPNNELNDGDPHWELRGGNWGCADGHVQWARVDQWNGDPRGRPVSN